MWFAFCCFLLAALDVTATTSTTTTQRRLPRGTSSTDGLILNSTDVVEVQLSPGSTSLKFEVCQKPYCKGTLTLWFSASDTDSSATQHKDGFCYLKHVFSSNIKAFEDCRDGEISESKLRFHDGSGNNPCGIEISDDRRLKVQLESLVEGCEVRVTNGAIWTGKDEGGNNLKVALAVGIPIGIIVVIGVTLLVVFVGRPWLKKRKAKKNRTTTANASKDPAKSPSAAILPVQTCAATAAALHASPTPVSSAAPSASSVPLTSTTLSASSVPPLSSSALPSSAPPVSSVPVTPAASSVPSESTVSQKSNGPSTRTEIHAQTPSLLSKRTKSNEMASSFYDIEYKPQ